METKKVVWLAVLFSLASILCFVGATLLFKSWYVYDAQQKDIVFKVMEEDHIGFDLNRTALTFGKVARGGGAIRSATLVTEEPAIAKIYIEPQQLAAWIVPDKNDIPVDKTGVDVAFTLSVPSDAPTGAYNGTVTIVYVRKMFWE
jgi:hypothetical protein